MLGITDYGTFVASVVIFLLIPGPGNLALITSTSKGGIRGGIAATLGVKLGDTLTFDIAGSKVSAKVTSLRKVDWDSFRVNFFALFPPGPLDSMPATYIAAFRAPEGANAWLPALVQKNPNILAIDIGEIVRQVQGIMDHVSRAIEFVFLFTLAGWIGTRATTRLPPLAVIRQLG